VILKKSWILTEQRISAKASLPAMQPKSFAGDAVMPGDLQNNGGYLCEGFF